MMPDFLLDTNHLGPALEAGSAVRRRIVDLRKAGNRIGICVPVLCEFEIGLQQVRKPVALRKSLARFLAEIRLWPLDAEAARLYGSIFLELRSKGRVLSQVDMMVAALAKRMGLVVATSDGDFKALPEIRTENWL